MSTINILGIDIGKSTFHLVGHDSSGREVFRKKLSRTKLILFLANTDRTTVAMESSGGSHWLARKCKEFGHKALLIPPQYVKPYVKTNKNDFIDADAIADAATRPSMRFASVKTETSQVILVTQRIRSSYLKDRTACMSRIGSMLIEFGMAFPKSHSKMKTLFQWLAGHGEPIPPMLLLELRDHHDYYLKLNQLILTQDKKLKDIVDHDERAQLLKTIPGVGNQWVKRNEHGNSKTNSKFAANAVVLFVLSI